MPCRYRLSLSTRIAKIEVSNLMPQVGDDRQLHLHAAIPDVKNTTITRNKYRDQDGSFPVVSSSRSTVS